MCGEFIADLFGFDNAPTPAAPKRPPDPAIEAGKAMAEEVKRNARRRGRLATQVTGGLGDPAFGANVSTPALSGVTYLGR